MTDSIIHFLRKLGFNRAISYGVLTRVWSLLAGPVTILMIATRLSKVQQGFYYTIGSLLAMQIFFELGLMTVIAQFASHEFAQLSWGPDGAVEGDRIARERFLDLLGKGVKWFAFAALVLVLVLVPTGLIFLGRDQTSAVDFAWRLPWILAVLGTAMNLLVVPFFGVVLGSGEVVSVNHREMIGAVVSSGLSWLVLGINGGLYAVFAVTTGNSIISWSFLLRRKPELLREAFKRLFHRERVGGAHILWWSEVWPLQWKVALTWVSGYFIFQLFTPVLFHYHGAVIAGQMGMTMSATNALLAVSLTWITNSVPEFGKFVALRNWKALDLLFYRVLRQTFVVAALGAAAGAVLIGLLQRYSQLGARFIPASHAGLLFAAIAVQVLVSGMASYLRAHKQEPLLPLSITLGVLQGLATWYFGMNYADLGAISSYMVITLVIALPVTILIWQRCRARWHSAEAQ